MSKFILQCELKQNTPMIHFQHDEKGAILRATEVKPKLDGFIVHWFNENKIDIPNSWYLPTTQKGEHRALAYKMRFKTPQGEMAIKSNDIESEIKAMKTNKKKNPERPICSSYFGNMKSISNDLKRAEQEIRESYKETVSYHGLITMSITCFKEEKASIILNHKSGEVVQCTLLEVIENFLPVFFKTHNFGTRQTKGFGSFQINKNSNKLIPNLKLDLKDFCKTYFCSTYYQVSYKKNLQEMDQEALNRIKKIYNTFRKDLLVYLIGISNDKNFIKNCVLKKTDQTGTEFRFIRAMLGLNLELKSGDKTVIVKDEKEEICRFASPLRFSVYEENEEITIFIFLKKIPDQLYDRTFLLNDKTIRTPTSEQFNLVEFIDKWIINNENSGIKKVGGSDEQSKQ